MNGPVLALIVVVALIIAVLLLRRRSGRQEPSQLEAPVPPPPPIPQPEAPPTTDLEPQGPSEPVPTGPRLEEPTVVEGGVTVTESPRAEPTTEPAETVPLSAAVPVGATGPDAAAEAEPEPEPEVEPEVEARAAAEPEQAQAAESIPPSRPVAVPVEAVEAGAELSPQIVLTLETYSARLNCLEEGQRQVLAQAALRRDDRQRDRLQRELVLMNDKLALLADSYSDELACYRQVWATLEALETDDHPGLAEAKVRLRQGDAEAAERLLADLSAGTHPLAAQAALRSGQLAECRVDLQQALALYRRAVELVPENRHFLRAAGKVARGLYQYQAALEWLETFVRLSGEQANRDPVEQALAQRELAYTYVLSGQYQKAGPLYKEAMTVLAQKLGADHLEMATSWYQIGELQETLGEYDKAVSVYRKSLVILEQKRGAEHPALANVLDKLAGLCMELELEKEAVPLYERLVRIREKALRPTHPQLALSLNNLAESYRLQGRYAEAEACYKKSLVINETLHGSEHPSVAAVLQELAKLCTSQRKPAEAQQYQQRASAIFQRSVEASEQKSGQNDLTLEI